MVNPFDMIPKAKVSEMPPPPPRAPRTTNRSGFADGKRGKWKSYTINPDKEDSGSITLSHLFWVQEWFCSRGVNATLYSLDHLQDNVPMKNKPYPLPECGPYIMAIPKGLDILITTLLLELKDSSTFPSITFFARFGSSVNISYKRLDQVDNPFSKKFGLTVDDGDLLVMTEWMMSDYVSIIDPVTLSHVQRHCQAQHQAPAKSGEVKPSTSSLFCGGVASTVPPSFEIPFFSWSPVVSWSCTRST